MHRSSESVAAIATALAKAQTELFPPKRQWSGRSITTAQRAPKASATLRYRVAWTSSARPWEATRSRLHRRTAEVEVICAEEISPFGTFVEAAPL